jgi:hypothetical protein
MAITSNIDRFHNNVVSTPALTETSSSQSLFDSPCSRVRHLCQGGLSLIKGGLHFTGYAAARSTCRKKQTTSYFSSWGFYHVLRGLTDVRRAWKGDKNLIATTYNLPKDPEKPFKQEILDHCFSKAVSSIRIRNLSFSRSDLDKVHWAEGVCSGSCSEFVSEFYHQGRAKGKLADKELVESVTRKLSDGIPPRAVYAQYLGDSTLLDNPELQTTYELKRFYTYALLYDNVYCTGGLVFSHSSFLNSVYINDFKAFLRKSNQGIYLVSFGGKMRGPLKWIFGTRAGHALVYIKCNADSFIFDPNIGALRISNDPCYEFIKLLKSYNRYIDIDEISCMSCVDQLVDPSDPGKITLPLG